MLVKIIKWIVGVPLGVGAYLYDDILWGPLPMALMTQIFGWPWGVLLLSIVYFVLSAVVAYFVLGHYRSKKIKNKQSHKKIKQSLSDKKHAFAYKLLLQARWIGLAVACFTLGAMLTSVVVGKLRLFTDINRLLLSIIMSFLFVVLFVGFYAGIFTYIINRGFLELAGLIFILAIVVKLVYTIKTKHVFHLHLKNHL